MTIGERIRFIRKQRNMTIDALAKSVGVTRQTISRYETGAIIEIPRNKLEKIAEELGVKYEYMEGWTLDSQCESTHFDIQQLKVALVNAKTDDERAEIENTIAVLEESYDDLLIATKMQHFTTSNASLSTCAPEKKHTVANMAKEWRSDKKANLTMEIDSWLLFALKGIAADSKHTLEDEIEEVLYYHVMNVIEEETNKENAMLYNKSIAQSDTD